MTDAALLRLRAVSADDITVLAACLQDAILPIADTDWFEAERRFVLALNRFRWEQTEPSRINTGLTINQVRTVQSKGFDRRDRGVLLNVLTLDWRPLEDGGHVTLICSEHRALRITVDQLDLSLLDFGAPWPVDQRPDHRLQ